MFGLNISADLYFSVEMNIIGLDKSIKSIKIYNIILFFRTLNYDFT